LSTNDNIQVQTFTFSVDIRVQDADLKFSTQVEIVCGFQALLGVSTELHCASVDWETAKCWKQLKKGVLRQK